MDKELLKKAREIAMKETVAEFLNENRNTLVRKARPKVAHIYQKLVLNSKAGKPLP